MISRWRWLLLQFRRRLWVRATLFSVLAAATAMIGVVVAPYIPPGLETSIGADSIDDILRILAVSMLTVTTFSLNVMVTAYGTVANSATPRAAALLRDDVTTQNVLGTFIGSFLYSLVGLIALSAGAYGDQGRVVLFVVTIGVIILIVATLLRWTDYLMSLGRLGETIDRVEDATLKALKPRIKDPYLGGRPLSDSVPSTAEPVYSRTIGYVQHIDIEALSASTKECGGQVFVVALPGTFVDPSRPVAHVEGIEKESGIDRVQSAFAVDQERSFDQDPRFGLCVLAEIASRALSPAVNDPGTAIDVIGRAVRILSRWTPSADRSPGEDIRYPNVWVPAISIDDLFDDIFTPIARDGASLIEVQLRLQKALLALYRTGGAEVQRSAVRHSERTLARAEAALPMEFERASVQKLAKQLAASAKPRRH